MVSFPVIATLALFLAGAAAIIDYRERRIPNRLTYPLLLIGLMAQALLHGWKGLFQGLAGGLVFGGIFLLFYAVHAMGAGDVKLAAALGCIVGISESVQLMFAVAIFGGILAIIYTLTLGRFRDTMRNTLHVMGFHARRGLQTHPEVNLQNPKAIRMPYGLAFAAGTLYWAVSTQFWK